MTLADRLKSPFPFYLNDDRKNALFILAVSLFVVFFLHVYRPYSNYHIDLTVPQRFLFGGVTYVVLFFNIVILPKILPGTFDPVNWTVGKYCLLTTLHLVLIGIISTLIDEFFICPERTFMQNAIGANIQVILTGIVPIALIFLFLKNRMLQQNLSSALTANQEIDKIRNLKKDIAPKAGIATSITILSNTSETLTFNLPDLLFIEADDNYATFYWKNGNDIQKKLLRINLKSIESQLDNSFAIRCHRSFIVNVNAISNIIGNTNGYKLQILDTDHLIPVARPKGKEVIDKIKQLRNVMELA